MQDKTFSEWVALTRSRRCACAAEGSDPPTGTPTGGHRTSPGEAGTGGRRCSNGSESGEIDVKGGRRKSRGR